jgi:hypothetical protein
MTTKADLHRLVDELPNGALEVAARRLEAFQSPLARSLYSAPPDDEPVTDEERAAVAEADADIAAGREVTQEELERELGL